MKPKILIINGLCICLLFCGCITDYEATGIEELADILVVEGIITENETTIMLSRSKRLTDDGYDPFYTVDNARVYVECEDGTEFHAYVDPNRGWATNGQYTINTGILNQELKYWLKIEIDEPDFNSDDCKPYLDSWLCPIKTYVYSSDPAYPIKTPEIDSVFWTKRGSGQPVNIHVATHSPDNKILYYRWSYREDWETVAEYRLDPYPFYCWNTAVNRNMLLGSSEKTIFGRVTDILAEMPSTSRRLMELYRIDVTQNAISKRAHDYFANIKKNSQQSGSIFAPVPSELRGNITCITDPGRAVIGYIDVSTTTYKRRYIPRAENAYERPYSSCGPLTLQEYCDKFGLGESLCRFPETWVPYGGGGVRIEIHCVDCSYWGGTNNKPEDWPNNH